MFTIFASFVLSGAWAQTSRPTDYINPIFQRLECGGATLGFRRGDDRVLMNGKTLAIEWTDDTADGVFDDGDIEGGHHLQVFADGSVRLNEEPCTDRTAP